MSVNGEETTMRLDRSVGLSLMTVILGLGSGWSMALGGDSAAETALNKKGLTRTGHTFLIEDEKPVLDKMKDVRGIFTSYATAAEKQATVEQMAMQSVQLDQQRAELQANLNMLNQQINASGAARTVRVGRMSVPQNASNNPMLAQKAQMSATLTQIGQTQQALKAQAPQPKDKAALDDDVKKKQEAFKSALSDLRQKVDEVTKKYADLGADETVKKSIDDLVKTSKAKVNLGPSDVFLAGVKELDRAERQFLGKKTPAASKKKTAQTKK
jgi:hypothetical protein